MKYQFIGEKIPYYGKTFWEIVANLKNFGVGRLVKTCVDNNMEQPSFFKIVKVQALPPSKQPFEERFVQVWVEEVHKGVFTGIKLKTETKYPRFILIPKIEEEKYYKAFEAVKEEAKIKHLCKFCEWPPVYQLVWKNTAQEHFGSLPNLKSVLNDTPGFKVIMEDKYFDKSTCSLYKKDMTVEDMYKEIVSLKKLIKSKSEASN